MTSKPVETTTSQTSSQSRDTGFPEPLSEERNTTLPHPEALTQPGEELNVAAIEATKSKTRKKLLARRRNSKNLSEDQGMTGEVEYADEFGNTEDEKRREGFLRRNVHKVEEKLHLRRPSK